MQQAQTLHFDQTVFLNNQPIQVAVFDTPAEREQGLMWVRELPTDHGALFVFEQESEVAFWMKNTLIPLDILFFDSSYKLVKLVKSAELCLSACKLYKVQHVQYVLELAASNGVNSDAVYKLGK